MNVFKKLFMGMFFLDVYFYLKKGMCFQGVKVMRKP